MNDIVLSSGDKIKAIRKKYKLKQEELAGADITRNLLSEIETGKANLTIKTAEIIIKNLKIIAKNKNFNVTETVDFLLETELSQANNILDKYIKDLRVHMISKNRRFNEILKHIEDFLLKWDIKGKKIIIYELAGDYFCNQNEFYQSIMYYNKALEIINKLFLSETLLSLLRKLSLVNYYAGRYDMSISYCEFALNHFPNMDDKFKSIFAYNACLSYLNINKFELALKNIKISESLVHKSDISKSIDIFNNKAICFYKMKMYKEALAAFNKALNLLNKENKDDYLIVLTNIVDCYLCLNMKDAALETFSILNKELIFLSDNSSYGAELYFDIGKTYKRLNQIDQAENCYLTAMKFAKNQKQDRLINQILSHLIDIYTINNNVEKMNKIKDEIILTASNSEHFDNSLILKLIKFYSRDFKVVEKLSTIALDLCKTHDNKAII